MSASTFDLRLREIFRLFVKISEPGVMDEFVLEYPAFSSARDVAGGDVVVAS
jgi:hypothetical protein